MFRIVKYVVPLGIPVDFYYTENGFWTQDPIEAKHFSSEEEVDKLVKQLNDKADRHYCHAMVKPFQITMYLKEEV